MDSFVDIKRQSESLLARTMKTVFLFGFCCTKYPLQSSVFTTVSAIYHFLFRKGGPVFGVPGIGKRGGSKETASGGVAKPERG